MRQVPRTRLAPAVLLPLLALLATAPAAQDREPAEQQRPVKTTPTIRTQIYERMLEAQTCLEDGDTACALAQLAELDDDRNLNAYERANLLNFYAVAYFELDDYDSAAGSYEAILALPRAELPDPIVQTAMKNLASAYWNLERPHDALAMLDQWMALPGTRPASSDWYLKATMHYQVGEFDAGVDAALQAIGLAEEQGKLGEESWYQLLAALYDELGETGRVIDTLTILVENWTRREHVLQLAGQLNQAGRDAEMLTLFEIAYAMGWLRSSSELVGLASLQLQAELPFKAAQVLEAGLADGRIEATERTWNMLAQAWQYAGHHAQAIPAFEEASALADDGNIDVRMAQSLARLARWDECVQTLERAFESGGIDAPDQAYLQLGHCHYFLKQWDEADAAFAQAEKTDRSRQTARQYRALVLSRRNTEAGYADALREALQDLHETDAP